MSFKKWVDGITEPSKSSLGSVLRPLSRVHEVADELRPIKCKSFSSFVL
jgi:hypothetical protein